MKPVKKCLGLFLIFLTPSILFATSREETRLRGFAEHQSNREQFGDARARGEKAYLEEQEQWQLERERNAVEYKKQKQERKMDDDGPEAKADEAVKKAWRDNREAERKEFVIERDKNRSDVVRGKDGIPTETEELNIAENRPRFDFRKRNLTGGKKSSTSSGGGGSSGGSWGGGGSPSFPTPPPFDDFGNQDGYVPAPAMPDDFGDVPPPPPPPPPPPFGDDPGFGSDMTTPIPPPSFPDDDF